MNKIPYWLPLLIFSVVSLATLGWVITGNESLTEPTGSMGDDVYFENIGYHLAKGEGIKFDFTDPEWQRPYRENNADGHQDWILNLKTKGLTTSRSPGFPLVIAAIYRMVGRQFVVVRIVNLVLLAGALTLLVSLVFRLHGAVASALALVTISLDCFILRTAGQFMTEALGTAIICILFVVCVSLTRKSFPISHDALATSDSTSIRKILAWISVGLLFGFGSLVRANLNAWFPLIVATLTMVVCWRWWFLQSWRPLLKCGAGFCIGFLLIAAPYWIRNCYVTGGFTPYGTSGSFGLIGGYCDRAYADFGNWSIRDSVESQQRTMAKPGFFKLTLAQQERWMGVDSTRLAEQWAWENRSKLPMLAGMKAVSHFGFYRQPLFLQLLNGLIFFGAAIGCYATRREFGFWVLVFLLLSVITTCLSWPHFGRYSIPVRPLIHAASAIGTVQLWTCFAGVRLDGRGVCWMPNRN